MAFFRKLFTTVLNRFPEFTDFLDAIQAIQSSGLGIIENSMAAFGEEFKRFANSQFPDAKANLEMIQENGNRQARAMRHLFLGTKTLKDDLEPIRRKNQEFLGRQAELKSAKDLVKSSRAAVGKAEEGLQRAERKGNQVDVRQAKAKVEQAIQKAGADEKAAEEAQASFDVYKQEYPIDFVDQLAILLEPAIDAKLEELNEVALAAQGIIEAAGKFTDYEDASIGRMRKRLDELDAIVIE
jgi:hypothetical protein